FELSNVVRIKNLEIASLSRWYNVPQGLSLPYDNNNLTFRFLGITMHQPAKVKYHYKLVGFDENWSALTSQNTAPYGNLDAGTYTFLVKAMNSEGVWSEPLSYTFTIRPPWWNTWWAYIIYFIVFILTISAFIRWRFKYLKARQKALEYRIDRATQEIRSQKEQVESQKKRSDELLLNILPEEVAEELKERGRAEARLISNVTVLFTDFKGFTQMSERLSPQDLVNEIHEYFSAFDAIAEKHGIEKIKTIGDAYMAAGGLPVPNETHALDVVAAAIDIRGFMEEQRLRKVARGETFFEIRIGIHTGPVVAGIVGVKKFQYDIWGDTVNTASRMESTGESGKINISQSTFELVKEHYNCEFRGELDAKGKGKLNMYFVK
ncbi:MAG: adenylate/guanylate cyclase domain-containing protein, partial [Flavobacteriales bacterium]